MITSFHEGMQGIVQYDGSSSKPFQIRNEVKQGQGCVLALTLLSIFFSLLLMASVSQKMAYTSAPEVMEGSSALHTSEQRPRCEEKIRELLFADDAALAAHTKEPLQQLISCFTCGCSKFSLTISLKKTNIMGQDLSSIPSISICDYILEVVEDFTYLSSTISSNLSLDAEQNTWIGKAATAMAHLVKRVWENSMLTISPKIKVYQASVLSTLQYMAVQHGLCTPTENTDSMPSTCINWQYRIPYKNILALTGIPSILALLTQRHLHWLGHASHMQDGQISNAVQ